MASLYGVMRLHATVGDYDNVDGVGDGRDVGESRGPEAKSNDVG